MSDTTTPTLSDSAALDALAQLLSADEWSPDTLDQVADIVRDTGRTVDEVPACHCDGQGYFTEAIAGGLVACACGVFASDDAAAAHVRANVSACTDCGETFADEGKGQRALSNPSVCEACLCR